MDFSETEEHTLLREAVQAIAANYGEAYALDKMKRGEPLDELWAELGAAGFAGVNVPESHGGAGLGILELSMVCEELAAAGCPLLLLLTSPAIAGSVLGRFGTEAQKQRWLTGIADASIRLAFAITEPDAGSNSHRLATTAVRDGDGWRLDGQKTYISGMNEAQAVLVVARTDERRLSLFVVDTDTPGLTATPIEMELRAPESQYQLFFDGVHVPADRLVGAEGDGLRQVFVGLNPERIMGAALANGTRLALAKASRYANERQVWGVPIGSHQGVAHPLAQARIEVELARLMTLKAAWLHDHGHDASEASNMAKYAAAEAGIAAVDAAIQTHGGNGMSAEYGVARLWGAVRTLRIAPVSREMILNFVAQHGLGLPKSY